MVVPVVPNSPSERTRPTVGVRPGLRRPSATDGPSLWALARASGLDLNSPYAYALWGEYFADTSIVAVDGDDVIGFITGFRTPAEPATVFVWQVAVSSQHRGLGIGGRMLDQLVEQTGARTIEATVTPSNTPSTMLFRSLAKRYDTAIDVALLFGSDELPEEHEAEIRFRVPVGGRPT